MRPHKLPIWVWGRGFGAGGTGFQPVGPWPPPPTNSTVPLTVAFQADPLDKTHEPFIFKGRLGDRLTAGLQTLDLPIKVRILVPQPQASRYLSSYSPVAQLVERVAVNHLVGGSNPSRGATHITP